MWSVVGKSGKPLRTLGLIVGIGLFSGMTVALMSSCANQAEPASTPNAKATQVIQSKNIRDPRLPPVLTATKVPQSTPVTPSKSTKGIELRSTPGTPDTPRVDHDPTANLVVDASAVLAGYWSDGTADVQLSVSLHNEGDLPLHHGIQIFVTCNHDEEVVETCGREFDLSLRDGFGPVETTFSLRVPTGDLSFMLSFGQAKTQRLEVTVPERILGVDRDVWECFSDSSNVDTIWAEDQGIGCGGWAEETVQKWNQSSPVRVSAEGPDRFVAEFKAVLEGLFKVMNLQLEWVDARSEADISAYVGLTVLEVESRRVFCRSPEAFGCASAEAKSGQIIRSEIIVFNLWPDQATDFDGFNDWHRTRFRSAMIHEAVHALGRLSHRAEPLSVMNDAVHHRAELSPMDEALLRLHGHELVKPGMTISELRQQLVFNDELLDPQPLAPRLASWKLATNAYNTLRNATSAKFRVQTSLPGCREGLAWTDYQVGNLTKYHSFFGWVRIDDEDNSVLVLQPSPDTVEYWRRTQAGWRRVGLDSFSEALPSWRGKLVDPHHILESVLYYADWTEAQVATDPNGKTTLNVELDEVRGIAGSLVKRVAITVVIDEKTREMPEYRMEWKLGGEQCGTYEVAAKDGQYNIDFVPPVGVQQNSDLTESCAVESLGSLKGYVRRLGSWARECGMDPNMEGYFRHYRFSLTDWAFVRFELLSPDDMSINLLKNDVSGDSPVDPSASGYLLGGHGVPDNSRLRWVHGPVGPGAYTLEVITKNRALPGTFTLIVGTQATPPPPYRFKTISAFHGHTCGLLLDGTPLCWGKRNVDGEGSEAPSGAFESISTGWVHSCGLRHDGTPTCWGSNQHGKASPPVGEKFLAIDAGVSHSCGIRQDRSAVCWGANWYGQLLAPKGERFVSINAGENHTCGLRENGTIACWGRGGFSVCTPVPGGFNRCKSFGTGYQVAPSPPEGERFKSLGSGSPNCGLRLDGTAACWTKYKSGLEFPPAGERFTTISSSSSHACGLRDDGTVVCWGRNRQGQASPPSGLNLTATPTAQPPVDIVLVSSGGFHTCALDLGGKAACWGPSWWRGRLTGQYSSISSGEYHSCGLRLDGAVACRGGDYEGQLMAPKDEVFESISSGGRHTCGLRVDGSIKCWGNNDHGQLSHPKGDSFTSISSGLFHTCALLVTGTPICWGWDHSGQVSIPENITLRTISSGGWHTCGLRVDGTAVCWGLNREGQAAPPPGETFTAISSGLYHTCALRTDETALCWGPGKPNDQTYDYGQTSPPAYEKFSSISTGKYHTCAVRLDRTVLCWGPDDYGQSSPVR